MTPTWRERSSAARARGYYDGNDMTAWFMPQTCPVGKAVASIGRTTYDGAYEAIQNVWQHAHHTTLQGALLFAMQDRQFDAFDRLLDQIEDAALVVKREMGS